MNQKNIKTHINNTMLNNLTSKELVYAAIAGKKPDHYPVSTAYVMLAHADHWQELTGLPPVEYYKWLIGDPAEHEPFYKLFTEKLPFDIFQPSCHYRSAKERENMEVVIKEGKIYYHCKKEDTYQYMTDNIHENGLSGELVEERTVFSKDDVREKVIIQKAEDFIASGKNDFLDAAVKAVGNDKFIINGGICNTFYACSWYVGLTNLMSLILEEGEFIHYLSNRILEQSIETIRAYSKAGGDAIYIDDAASTNDMISREQFEEYCLPYLIKAIDEIHRQGKLAFGIYFGGIDDRADLIASAGYDIVLMETSMKGFINDYKSIYEKMEGKVCLMGNLNPYDDIQLKSEQELYETIKKQVETGRSCGKYITSTGSPITPNTSVERIRRFIDIAHAL